MYMRSIHKGRHMIFTKHGREDLTALAGLASAVSVAVSIYTVYKNCIHKGVEKCL